MHQIQVGSVESFQGQEKKIIIVSTVRTRISNKARLGFVAEKKVNHNKITLFFILNYVSF